MARINSKTIGVVVQQYTRQTEDLELDKVDVLPYSLEEIRELLEERFKEEKHEIQQYVIARERGEKGREHFQCMLSFENKFRSRKGHYIIDKPELPVALVVLFEPAKSVPALIKYCMKDGDFIVHLEGKTKRDYMVQKISTLSDVKQLQSIVEEEPGLVITGDLQRIKRNIEIKDSLLTAEPESKEFMFPEHMKGKEEFAVLENWFNSQCVPIGDHRRQALVIYSKERALGKTTFAKSLVDMDERRYIICRNTFTSTDFDKPYAQLLILDDMTYLDKHKEQWKALISSEATSIRDAFCNYAYKGKKPVILTTNNINFFRHLYTSEYFKYDCHFFMAEDYLGPEGTDQRKQRHVVKANFTPDQLASKVDIARQEVPSRIQQQFGDTNAPKLTCSESEYVLKSQTESALAPMWMPSGYKRVNEFGLAYAQMKRDEKESIDNSQGKKKIKPMFIGAINEL